MKPVMYGSAGNGDLVEMQETPYEKEVNLQEFLSRHPALLAGDQMNPLDPRRFVLITAEAGIAIAKDAGNHFSLDHLFIDQDGIPTLVEVKRSTDTRLRREVVGQMLEYAANACAYWAVDHLRLVFEQRCRQAGISPEDELSKLTPGRDIEPDNLWERVTQNLRQERLRLVFVADSFSLDTKRIIEFLNRQMESTEVYAVEVRQYEGGGLRTLSPRVLNPSVHELDRRSVASGRGEKWNADRFYSALLETSGQQAVDVFLKICEWAEAQPHVATFFGRGRIDGSIQITFKREPSQEGYRPGDDVVFLTLWSYGRAEVEFQYLMTTQSFQDPAKRKELLRRLVAGPALAISEDKIDKRPNVQWSELVDPGRMRAFLAAQAWIVAELGNE